MATKEDKEPFLQNDTLQIPSNDSPNPTVSPDLGYSIGIPQLSTEQQTKESQEDYTHNDDLDSPPSPRSPRDVDDNQEILGRASGGNIDEFPGIDIHKKKDNIVSLSKKLFNLEHYIMIPLMFFLSFFVYYDRGGLAAALDNIQTQLLNDNAFQSGAVAACYLFGYCFTSPIFALLGSKYPPIKMSSIGMVVWCIGAFLTGWPGPSFMSSFVWLSGARLLTGIGEASFLAFAGTIIDIIAPDSSRSLWLGTFYMGIPLGYAMGYAVGGTIADMSIYVVNNCDDDDNCNESWRAIFVFETFIVLPLCVVLFCIKQPPNMLIIKQAKDLLEEEEEMNDSNISIPSQIKQQQDEELQDAPISTKLLRLLTNRTFIFASAGYSLQTFVTGTFAVEAITYLQKVYDWNSTKAGTTFGVITFISGVTGSIFGGYVLDKMKSKLEHDSPPHLYCKPALKLLVFLSFISFPFAFIVVIWNSVPVFVIGAALTEFFIFASAGPVNNVILWCVLYEDRPLAAALNTLAIHALGDACAPLAVGAVIDSQTSLGKTDSYAYNFAFGIAVFWLIFSGIAFIAGVWSTSWLEAYMTRNGQTRRKTSLLINDPSH